MPIPQFEEFMTPALQALQDGAARTHSDVEAIVCPMMGISSDEQKQLLPSGTQTIVRNRLSWAMFNMYRAGLLIRPKRGIYQITDEGIKALALTKRIDNEFLDQYEGFRIFKNTSHRKDTPKTTKTEGNIDPVTRISNAIEEFNKKTCQDLIEQLKKTDPIYFEKICLELMKAMGYGDEVSLTPKSHDGGIDGIVNEDALGLDKIYLQAKRYVDNKVNEREIQNFIGALSTSPVTKGVFITTSYFSDKAKDRVSHVLGKSIKLIDGDEMAKLMLKYNVGVQVRDTYQIKELDENFFSDEE